MKKFSKMRIFINFRNGKYITLQVQPNDLIGSIKSMIEEREGVPLKDQEFSFRRQMLIDEKDIESYSVQEEPSISLNTSLIVVHLTIYNNTTNILYI